MTTLVYVEDHEGEPVKGSIGVLSKAAQLGDDVAAIVCGSGVAATAESVGKFGASRVLVADDPALERPLPQPRVDILARVVAERGFDTVLFGASVLTADIASALAARLGGGLNWDLIDLETHDGRLVLAKASLFLLLISLGAYNQRRLLPRLRQRALEGVEPGRAGALLRRAVAYEVGFALVVLSVTSVLVVTQPGVA